ncbi:hypothetical protein EB155_09415 [archaeon]|nr:hypothetical protein [archaeon]
MAFINQTFAKQDGDLLKVGGVYDTTPRDVVDDTGPRLTFNPGFADVAELDAAIGKVIEFSNGQVKTIVNKVSDGMGGFLLDKVDVDPSNIEVPPNATFELYYPSLYIDGDSRIHFGRSTSGVMMNGETGIDLNFGRIRNVSLPTHAHDVATKQYVDSLKLGVWNHIESFVADGVTTIYDVTVPISIYNALVVVGGVIQKPFEAYNFTQYDGFTRIDFGTEPPPLETEVVIRASTGTNVSMSAAIEEIFIASNNQQEFALENEVYDKFGLLVSIDGVVQSSLNYDILTTPVSFSTQNGTQLYKGNEYKRLVFAEGLDVGAVVRVLNLRGKGFHHHTGTFILLNNTTLVPNTTFTMNGVYAYETIENSNNTVNITHDMIASRGGLHLYANTSLDDLYINLPEMGGEYSPDQHLEVKVVKHPNTANVWINADVANFMNWEGVLDGWTGGGVVYNQQNNVPTVIHLEWESFYKTWYIKYGMGLWHVNANTVSYPDVSPY